MQKEAKTKAQIELNEKQKMSRSLFPQEYNSIIKRKKKKQSKLFLWWVSARREYESQRETRVHL